MPVRELALDIVRATLSARGFHQARSIMRINQLVAELSGDFNAFGEWPYFVSVFGDPAGDAPWGWQIDGHHLCINTMVFDGRIVMTPSFMGSEPRRIHSRSARRTVAVRPGGVDRAVADALARRRPAGARRSSIPSIHPDDISPQLQNMFDGRMQAGAVHDNLVAPYQGVAGTELSEAQRRMLLELAGAYVGWSDDPSRRGAACAEVTAPPRRDVVLVVRRVSTTWRPFYYRVHSPVILIEFDHHPGVVFDNEVPTRHHVHTVVRTPNGGDYGRDLLRQHHEQFDHTSRRPPPSLTGGHALPLVRRASGSRRR